MFCFSDQSINELNTDQQFTDRPQNLKKTNITFGIRTSNLDCAIFGQWAFIWTEHGGRISWVVEDVLT